MSAVLLYTRYQFRETVRIPMAALGTLAFPTLFMLLFVVSNRSVSGNTVAATEAAGQMSMFAVISAFVFNLGAGVAEDRAKAWHSYLRTLPTGPMAQLGGRLCNALCFALLSLIPVGLTAVLFTAAEASVVEVGATVFALVLAGVPFAFLGLAVGYSMPLKAAIPTVQLILFPLAFAGGLFLPPSVFPDWLDGISTVLPTRAARELVLGALTGGGPPLTALAVAVGWTAALGALAVFTFRRDEGRRFR
ncbi:ABC-2 type transport system permease protein [Actinopolyspora lacussalsi subsp. righensis]|uniref:ABC-2 type transport system permease protein n=1 Tax=Actinopolyspora righensis TaxID=995060 RepID=A0A1I7B594_9ACTN|nr:ABC transporter permease [Actinopolyspora righensis]SFT82359.1 ABC-2 type transport system permease protein [Actinopolyspora righensis]